MGGYNWGKVEQDELVGAIRKAIDTGVNFFDTADTYGLGQSEKTLAKGLGANRKDVIIETKFGVRVEGGRTFYDNSPDYIEAALDNSLRRLDTDYIDVYLIHYRDGVTPMEDVVGKLIDLREKGKIRYFGLSNVTEQDIEEIKPFKGLFVNCQNEFSLACRKNEKDLRKLQSELDLTPMTWGSLGQGILTGKYDLKSKFGSDDRRRLDIYVNFHGDKLKKNMEIVDVLREIAVNRGKTLSACAIRFILDCLPESVALAGIKRADQLISNLDAMGWSFTPDEFKALDEVSKL
ncbi:MAG: aldo/keto reductase [Ruminococcaceae bacterium]|nr:aldo/keto reductase [Oscillospiraceae bacterium]